MDKQNLYVGNILYGSYKLEYDKLYYTESIQKAINEFVDNVRNNDDLKECLVFIKDSTDVVKFMKTVVNKIAFKFQDKNTADKIIFEYSKQVFHNFNENLYKQIDKNAIAEDAFDYLMKKEFLKIKPLMANMEKKIYEVLEN